MRRITLFLLLLILVPVRGNPQTSDSAEQPSFGKYFKDANLDGCFLLYDLKLAKYAGYNIPRANTGYIPASTYKIFNSLVALETGVARDENEIVKWDGVDRGSPQWNRDQSMRTAFKYSAAWFYQEMARRIGREKMQQYVDRARYGNGNLSGGIDRFWLDGGLRITAKEQIELLVRLYRNDLPFSQRTTDIVKAIMIDEKNDRYVLRAKTGWADAFKPQVGWWVGYVERKDNVYFFAVNIDINKNDDARARREIATKVLREMNVID